jgi:hypothetical protein
MLAYIFWHAPFANTDPRDYEAALLGFQADLAAAPPPGLASCAAYRIAAVPWLDDRPGYEDWYFVNSFAALEALNDAAINARRAPIHAGVASKMEVGHGGLYRHFLGEAQAGSGRVAWLRRPRGIQYEQPLREIATGATGFASCWRRQMVLGPAEEFAVAGSSELELSAPPGWTMQMVERTALVAR